MPHRVSSGFQARRALLRSLAPRYQQASPAQKTFLLDAFVEWTGYSRKYAIELLNHGEHGQQTIQRHRSPWYGQAVQQALFLAWKATHYVCAKRLLPSLPSLVAVLERQGHLAVLSWLKFEWQKGSWALVGLAPTDRVGLHTRLAATVAFRLDQLKQLVGRAAN